MVRCVGDTGYYVVVRHAVLLSAGLDQPLGWDYIRGESRLQILTASMSLHDKCPVSQSY